MNTSLNELKQVLVDNQVTNVTKGLEVLNDYFKGFEFHELKDEYIGMSRDERKKLIKNLLNQPVDLSGDQPVDISDTRFDDITESDIDDGLVNLSDTTDEQLEQGEIPDETDDQQEERIEEVTDEPVEQTELQVIRQQEIDELLVRQKELTEELNTVNSRLFELTGETDKSESKMVKAKRIFEQNKGMKRKDMLILFQEQAELTKAGAATYYNNIVNSNKKK